MRSRSPSPLINASILGATGYTGAELLSILLSHPHVQIRHATSESSAGKRVDEVHPALKGRCSLVLEKPRLDGISSDSDVAFLALPAGQASRSAAALTRRGCRIIDLSADFRLKNARTYSAVYRIKHRSPGLLKKAVYGLPELFPILKSEILEARIVANPGCYATAALLGLAPLVKHKLIGSDSVIVDAKSGVSGAGKKMELSYHFSEANENMAPYAVMHHRQAPEMELILSELSGKKVLVIFAPQLAPMTRGILAMSYAKLKKGVGFREAKVRFARFYQGKPFVRLLEDGRMPQTKAVLHTNFCDIGMAFDPRTKTIVVASAIDNLVKGASGQAVQNMNLMFGFAETEALL